MWATLCTVLAGAVLVSADFSTECFITGKEPAKVKIDSFFFREPGLMGVPWVD